MCRPIAQTAFDAGKAAGENDKANNLPLSERPACPSCWKDTTAEMDWLRGYETGRFEQRQRMLFAA